ncbi:MAG TPA: hypothetical protein VHL58_17385 [Thermoanaerobaculia bacterium]|nr:hypothetical protein [Thermoanaerobaculia bacterium]
MARDGAMKDSIAPHLFAGIAILTGMLGSAGAVSAQTPSPLQIHGFLTAREIYVSSQPSWTRQGFGRFDVGADDSHDHRLVNVDVAQLGIDWTPKHWLTLHADGIARLEPSGTKGSRAGLLQAYAEVEYHYWRLRAGAFWLPTSRENVDNLWTSRYTISYSALNSWIGQEVRPIGADLQYSPNLYLVVGATAFRGNDTMGTELSARGWTFGNRLSVYNEDLPLPQPETSTRPVGKDIDDRNGYAERVRLQLPDKAMLQIVHIDNRASIAPEFFDQEPWRTKFDVVSAEIGAEKPTTFSSEWASGTTAVGFPGGVFTLDFDTVYALLSHKRGPDRWTVRVERFSTRDHERRAVDSSRENGHAVTVAWLRDVGSHLRAGLEYVRVTGDRPGLAASGLDPRTGGSTVSFEVRYGF